jgi:hypothetical protein
MVLPGLPHYVLFSQNTFQARTSPLGQDSITTIAVRMAAEDIPSLIPVFGAPDYRDWMRLPSLESNAEKDRIVAREIIPHLDDYTEGGLLTENISRNSSVGQSIGGRADGCARDA